MFSLLFSDLFIIHSCLFFVASPTRPLLHFLFFFFNHKTSYEVRISDWSSDVCSSDLGPVIDIAMLRRIIDDPAQPDVAAVGADRTNLIRLVVLEEQSLRIAIGLDLVEIEEARVALVGLNEEALAVVRPFDEARDMLRARRHVARGAVELADIDMCQFVAALIARKKDALVVRSEEHTSELQSLMRNSYAVFCLTKKKK